ncbi:MAG TPA: hypothetical protein VFF32_05835, partial [Dermatophilaceae bacterium]|nr:hypothetical protein [Dermatophilaceae bacterium]
LHGTFDEHLDYAVSYAAMLSCAAFALFSITRKSRSRVGRSSARRSAKTWGGHPIPVPIPRLACEPVDNYNAVGLALADNLDEHAPVVFEDAMLQNCRQFPPVVEGVI